MMSNVYMGWSKGPMVQWLADLLAVPKWEAGTGTISTAGSIMCGCGTMFRSELKAGDRIRHPRRHDDVVTVKDVVCDTYAVLEQAPMCDFDGDAFEVRTRQGAGPKV